MKTPPTRPVFHLPVMVGRGWTLVVFILGVVASEGWASGTSVPVAQHGQSRPAATGPRIEFPVLSHDFGTVGRGRSVRHDFVVRNTGTAPLEILDVRPACGCTIVAQWTAQIEPGGSGVIPIQLETAQFIGPISKSITVTSNDPIRRLAVLEIAAKIWTPIEVAMPVVVFPALTQLDQVISRSVRISNHADEPVALSALEIDQPIFRPELREITPGREFELVLTTVPPLREGTFSARVTMKTSHPDMPELSVQAVATLLPAVQVAPVQIVLPSHQLATAETRSFMVFNHRAGDLRLSDLHTNLEGVAIATSTSEDRKQITVTLTFPAALVVRPGEKLFVRGKTSHPGLPDFEVPIVGGETR